MALIRDVTHSQDCLHTHLVPRHILAAVPGILFLNYFHALLLVKYGNLVECDYGPPAEGAARFHATHRIIVVRGGAKANETAAGLSRLCWYPHIFARRRRHSLAEIHALSETLIATGKP